MKPKFKVGDKVVVVGNRGNPNHYVEINSTGEVIELRSSTECRVSFSQKYNTNRRKDCNDGYFTQTINQIDLRHHDDYILDRKI